LFLYLIPDSVNDSHVVHYNIQQRLLPDMLSGIGS